MNFIDWIMNCVVIEIWERVTNSQNCSFALVMDLGNDSDDLRRITNVIGRGEAAQNPFGIAMRSYERNILDKGQQRDQRIMA